MDHSDSDLGAVVDEFSGGISQFIFGLFTGLLLIIAGVIAAGMTLGISQAGGGKPIWGMLVFGVLLTVTGIGAGIIAFFVWKRRVIIYAEGISDIWINKQRTIRWDSVSEFRLKPEPIKDNSSILIMFGVIGFLIWLIVPKPKPAGLFLISKTAEKINLPPYFPDFKRLAAEVQSQIFKRQLFPAIENIKNGKMLDFSGYLLDSKGIVKGNSRIEWSAISAMWRADNNLEIYGKDIKRVWTKVPYEDLPNGQLLAEIMVKYYDQVRKAKIQ
jgi:hypothetical protein